MGLLLTTNPGVEDVLLSELAERAAAAGLEGIEAVGERGAARARLPPGVDAAALVAGMRSIHHALRPLIAFELDPDDPLGDARRRAARLRVPELAPGRTFRVTGVRKGAHDFTSEDLQRAVGAGLLRAHDVRARMKGFDIEIRAEVQGSTCDLSVQLTRRALSARGPRPYRARTALKANVAYAMIRLALDGQPPPRRILDPFCGSGTLLIEAGASYPAARLVGVEKYEKPAFGARANLEALGLAERASVRLADGRRLPSLFPEAGAFDAILSNPPYGARMGRSLDYDALYGGLLAGAAHCLRGGGRLAVLALRRDALNRALRRQRAMRTVHVRVIDTGGLHPGLFVLARALRADDRRQGAAGGGRADPAR